MKTLGALETHLLTGATTLSWCWRITRADGQVFGFTDHDRSLTFDGTTFESESVLVPSETFADFCRQKRAETRIHALMWR